MYSLATSRWALYAAGRSRGVRCVSDRVCVVVLLISYLEMTCGLNAIGEGDRRLLPLSIPEEGGDLSLHCAGGAHLWCV